MLAAIAIAIIAAVGLWMLGGIFLRVGGVVLVFVGVISLVSLGDPIALLLVLIGLAMWLAGHWHFAMRHHEYKSPLAQRIFLQVLPRRYDPTRHWGMPLISEESTPVAPEQEPRSEPEDPREG
jgi:hypothetical protein